MTNAGSADNNRDEFRGNWNRVTIGSTAGPFLPSVCIDRFVAMTGDQHPSKQDSRVSSPDESSRRRLLTEDDEHEVMPNPKLASEASGEPEVRVVGRGPSAGKRRRRNRALKLLAATLLTGVFITIVMLARGARQQPTVESALAIAPRILFEQRCEEIRQGNEDTLHITEYAVDDAMVEAMAGLDSLETVIFDQGAVTDEAMETIATLPKLQHLRLRLSPIGDQGMKRIAEAKSLWYLNLPHVACTSAGVGELAALPALRQLRLGSRTLGNDVTREIAKITSLRGIHLIGIGVTDEGLKTLAAMKHLESLYLDDVAVTEAGWEWLFREHPHLHVHVNQAHHDRDPHAHQHHEPPTSP